MTQPVSDQAALAKRVTFPASQKGHVAQLHLTPNRGPLSPLHFDIQRNPEKATVADGYVSVSNPFVSRDPRIHVAWNPDHALLLIANADAGESRGIQVTCPGWSRPEELCMEGLAIFVGTSPPQSVVRLTVGTKLFLEVMLGTGASLAPPSSRVLYGIDHSDRTDTLAVAHTIMLDAYCQGATTVGMEMSPAVLEGRYQDQFCDLLASEAKALDMGVVPLLTNELQEGMHAWILLTRSLSVMGGIDQEALERHIDYFRMEAFDVREKLAQPEDAFRYAPPEAQPEPLRKRLPYLELMGRELARGRDFMKIAGYDLDAWAAAYRHGMAEMDQCMRYWLEQVRPDVAIMGALHARNLVDLPGYAVRDLTLDMPHQMSRLSTTGPLAQAVAAIARSHCWPAADFACRCLDQMVHEKLGRTLPAAKRLALLDRAVRIDPQLLRLTLRAQYHTDTPDRALVQPIVDLAMFKLSVDDARARIIAAIRRAIAERTLRGYARTVWTHLLGKKG